jgi:hypothetical protein
MTVRAVGRAKSAAKSLQAHKKPLQKNPTHEGRISLREIFFDRP